MFDSIGALNNLLLRRGRPLLPLILLPGANSNPESKASQKDNKDSDGNENNQHVCSKNNSNPHCDNTARDTTTVFMTSVGPTISTSTTLTITPTSESEREEIRTDSLATPDAAGVISPTQVQLDSSATGSSTVILPVTRVITTTTDVTIISTSTTATNTNGPAASDEEGTTNHPNAGIIAGSITGGIVLLASIGIAILIKRRRRQPVRMNHRTSSLESVGLSSIFGSVPSFIQPISPTHDPSRTDKREIPPFTPGIFEDSDGVSLAEGYMHSLKVNHSSIP